MKYKKMQKIAVIDEKNGESFESKFNQRMSEISGCNIRYEMDKTRPFLAYIFYEEEELIPENIKEEYELEGCTYHCGQCPEYQCGHDKRRKWNECSRKKQKVHAEMTACEWYYRSLENAN